MDVNKNGLFITGTGTDVGKTFASGFLLAILRNQLRKALYYKPIQCGPAIHAGATFPQGDAQFIQQVMGHPDVVNTWFLRNPSSPHLAFALEGITYDAAPIHDLIISSRKNFDFIIMEGAGGIRVPITEKLEMTDIAKLSSFPTLVVAKPGLGTINHTLLTLEHLASRRLPLAGFVFSEPEQAKFAEALAADNAHIIQARTGVPFLGCIPYFKGEWSLSDLTSHPLADYFRRTK